MRGGCKALPTANMHAKSALNTAIAVVVDQHCSNVGDLLISHDLLRIALSAGAQSGDHQDDNKKN